MRWCVFRRRRAPFAVTHHGGLQTQGTMERACKPWFSHWRPCVPADFAVTPLEAGFKRDGCEVERLQNAGCGFSPLSKDGHVATVSAKRRVGRALAWSAAGELQSVA